MGDASRALVNLCVCVCVCVCVRVCVCVCTRGLDNVDLISESGCKGQDVEEELGQGMCDRGLCFDGHAHI